MIRMAKLQHYKVYLSSQFCNALLELERLQAVRVGLRLLGPAALEIEISQDSVE